MMKNKLLNVKTNTLVFLIRRALSITPAKIWLALTSHKPCDEIHVYILS